MNNSLICCLGNRLYVTLFSHLYAPTFMKEFTHLFQIHNTGSESSICASILSMSQAFTDKNALLVCDELLLGD